MRIVGVNHSGYNTRRNISDVPFKNYKVEKRLDFFKFPEHLYYRLTHKIHPLLFNLHQDFGLGRCDLWHFFNTVSLSHKPWITTFETRSPRFTGKNQRMGMKLIAGKHCKKLIAMSESARQIELQLLKESYPEYYDAISAKLIVQHPGQKILVNDYASQKRNDLLSFVLVGHEFFLKGGNELLAVFDRLYKEGKDFRFFLVSKMEYSVDAFARSGYETAMGIIKKYPGKIIHHTSLPNAQVLELLKTCHVALLPSYRETYGYSVLEAQAAGCPVITTNGRALGEINNNSVGWIINVPRDERTNQPYVKTQEEIATVSAILEKSLEEIIRGIIDNPASIALKGTAAIARIKQEHDPDKTAVTLEAIYDKALS